MKWLSPCPVKNFVIKIFFLNLNEMATEELTEIKTINIFMSVDLDSIGIHVCANEVFQ